MTDKYWHIHDLRTGDKFVIKAATAEAAHEEFLECCGQNVLIDEASEGDLEDCVIWGETDE